MERTIPKPLGGNEIIEAICTRIKNQLSRDCFLTPHLAYASFAFQADIRIQFQNDTSSIKETNNTVHGQGGETIPDTDMESVDVKVEDVNKPPNEVRVEAGIGVPAIVTNPKGGVEEKRLKYAPKGQPATTAKKSIEQGKQQARK